jgi:hypothetical protein
LQEVSVSEPGQDEEYEDGTLSLLKDSGVPVTRENYLQLAYMGQLPEEWTWEHEMDLPPELQESDPTKWDALNAAASRPEPPELRTRHADVVAAYPQLTDDYLDKLEDCT